MKIIHGNILNETKGIIVHGCNAQGVMGSGLAGQIKNKYPQVYYDYIKTCTALKNDPESMMYSVPEAILLGKIITTPLPNGLIIISGITQLYYGRNPHMCYVDYDAIKSVFQQANQIALNLNFPVKIPKIGAGLANGNWETISEIIETTLDPKVDLTLFVFN